MVKIFTWHVHGSYLFYLSQGPFKIYIPVTESRREPGYHGRGSTFPFGDNVVEVPIAEVPSLDFDVVLFQADENYFTDQYEVLSEAQRRLPQIYLEHDTPRQHPTNEKHLVTDPAVTLVHVTHYNRLMWDNNGLPAQVIEHGVTVPENIPYSGEIPRGLVIINNLSKRGRTLGADIFLKLREKVPLDLIGMGTEDMGLGEVLHPRLPAFLSKYRFYFHPARYTSLGLSVIEAMMLGVPVAGLATTELPTVLTNGATGFVHNDLDYLAAQMHAMIADRELAARIGQAGREVALKKFHITRFAQDWERLCREVIRKHKTQAGQLAAG